MEVITIEKKTYEAMMERFRILTAKVDALCRECDEKHMQVAGQSGCLPNPEHQFAYPANLPQQPDAALYANRV